jgi:prepilin peptidase CpaA
VLDLSFPIMLVLAASSIAAVTDVWKFKVYNVLTLPLLAGGLIYHVVDGGRAGLAGSIIGAVVGFSVMIMIYTMGGMGAGDVKFVTALGAWLGLPLTLSVIIAGCIAAGLYALILLVAASSWRETVLNLQILWHRLLSLGRLIGSEDRVEVEVNRLDRRRRLIPFSAMIALGLVATILWLRK